MTVNNLVARYQSTHEPFGTVTQEITRVVPTNVTPDFYYKGFRFITAENYANSQLASITGVSDLQEGFDKISEKAYKKGYFVNPIYSTKVMSSSSTKAVVSEGSVMETNIRGSVPYITSFKETSSVFIGLAYISREDIVTNFNVDKRVSSQRKESLFNSYAIYIDSVKKGNFYDYAIYFNKTLVYKEPDIFSSSILELGRVVDDNALSKLTGFLEELSVKDAEDVAELFTQTAKPVYLALPNFLFYT